MMASKGNRSKISKGEVMRLKEIFCQYDTDGSGSISLKELQSFFLASGQNMEDMAQDFVESMDRDGDGSITFFELLKELYPYTATARVQQMVKMAFPDAPQKIFRPRKLTEEQQSEISQLFELYDSKGDGFLDAQELMQALPSAGYTDQEMEDLVKQYDKDKDGKLSPDEFLELMRETYDIKKDDASKQKGN